MSRGGLVSPRPKSIGHVIVIAANALVSVIIGALDGRNSGPELDLGIRESEHDARGLVVRAGPIGGEDVPHDLHVLLRHRPAQYRGSRRLELGRSAGAV